MMILQLIKKKSVLLLAFSLLCSCTKTIYNDSIRHDAISEPLQQAPISGMKQAQWRPSPNFGVKKTPALVILHHTATGSLDISMRTLSSPKAQVSSHYLIAKDGTIYQLVDEQYRAWHAGVGSWNTIRDINSSSIGIEIVNSGGEPFPVEQINGLKALLGDLKRRYNIPARNFIGHLDIAPGRKIDPSNYFPWNELAKEGFGIWYDENEVNNKTTYLPVFDPIWAFAIIGYNTNNIQASIKAFKQHYLKEDPKKITTVLDDKCYRVLYSLVKQALSIPTVITSPQNIEPMPDLYFDENTPAVESSIDNNYPELQ